jgi:hypothetical protein
MSFAANGNDSTRSRGGEGFAEIGNLAMGATTMARALVFAIATKFPALHPFTTTSIDTHRGAPSDSFFRYKFIYKLKQVKIQQYRHKFIQITLC